MLVLTHENEVKKIEGEAVCGVSVSAIIIFPKDLEKEGFKEYLQGSVLDRLGNAKDQEKLEENIETALKEIK